MLYKDRKYLLKSLLLICVVVVLHLVNIWKYEAYSDLTLKILASCLFFILYFVILWYEYKFFTVIREKNNSYMKYYPLIQSIPNSAWIVLLICSFLEFLKIDSNNSVFVVFIIHSLYMYILSISGIYKHKFELIDRNNFNAQSGYRFQNDMYWTKNGALLRFYFLKIIDEK